MSVQFEHEQLPVYRESLDFAKWSETILERTPKNSAAYAQLDQGRTSLLLKVAAASGKLNTVDRSRSLGAAESSALESAACLDILFNKRILSKEELQRGKEALRRIAASLTGMDPMQAQPIAD